MVTLSGKCGRCGTRIYRSVSEEAETSCPTCGQKLKVRVGALPHYHEPDPEGPLTEAELLRLLSGHV